jgi:hypothetical protein
MNRNENGTEWTRMTRFGAWILAIAVGGCLNGPGEERGWGHVDPPPPPEECRAGDWTCSEDNAIGAACTKDVCVDGSRLRVCGADGVFFWDLDCAQNFGECGAHGQRFECLPVGWDCRTQCLDDRTISICWSDLTQLEHDCGQGYVCDDENAYDPLTGEQEASCRPAGAGGDGEGGPADLPGACGEDFDCGDAGAGTCFDGVCQCEQVQGEVEVCEGLCTILDTSENCGGCGNRCSARQSLCWFGTCQTCDALGLTACNDGCKDVQYDSRNCGECGRTCRGGRTCQAGVCL